MFSYLEHFMQFQISRGSFASSLLTGGLWHTWKTVDKSDKEGLLNHLVVEILAGVALHQAVATLLDYTLAHTAAEDKLFAFKITIMYFHLDQ